MSPPPAALICTCPECRALDRAHPRDGRQLALISLGEQQGLLPLTDPDAPAFPAAGVGAPRAAQSRHARSRPKQEAFHA